MIYVKTSFVFAIPILSVTPRTFTNPKCSIIGDMFQDSDFFLLYIQMHKMV